LTLSAYGGDVSSKIVIEAKEISKAFGDKMLISNFSTRVLRGDRMGVIGANGSGKTTLLKILVKQLEPDTGMVKVGPKVDLVYFDQMRETLKGSDTLWQTLCPSGGDQVYVGGNYRHVVSYLKDFLFQDKQIMGVVSILSGGEKNRLALAKALAQPSNVLVLDEPTNDLDMDTLDLLIEMLADYDGTIILVSHDRDFLNKTVTSIIAVEGDGAVEEYVGGYDDYIDQRTPKKLPPNPKKPKDTIKLIDDSKATKRLSYNQQRLLDTLPGVIENLEKEINEIEQKLTDPDFYTHHPKEFATLSARLNIAQKEHQDAEETWLELLINN
ncbi:MAG: ATP-binding cassette domain-containing protein, partial [Alphaproteobacteria bacterium]|nr:ATP-binding cassette domain-containing protein [Alphaproteobacteria bacterium]